MSEYKKNIQDPTQAANSPLAVSDELYALIRDCIAGDRTAQKKLYDQFAPAAYGVIKRYINNDHDAQEILNDAFFKVFTKLNQYSFQGVFAGWIRRIVVNSITDHVRKNVKEDKIHKVEAQPNDASIGADMIGKLAYKELLQLIHSLPQTQRTVFNLFVFENLSHREIGEILNINENNSKWYLNDARKRLKEKLNVITKK